MTRTGGQKPDTKDLGTEWGLIETKREDAFRKADVLGKQQRTQNVCINNPLANQESQLLHPE